MSPISRQRAWALLRFAVPVVVLGAVLWTIDWGELVAQLAVADYRLLALAFLMYHVAVFLQGWRWHVLLASDGAQWPYWRLQAVHYTAMFFDIFTPGKLGSDAYRVAASLRPGKAHHVVISLVAMRLHGMLTAIAFAAGAGGILFSIRHGRYYLSAGLIVAALLTPLIGWKLYRIGKAGARQLTRRTGVWQRIGFHLGQAAEAFDAILSRRKTLVLSCVLAVVFLFVVVGLYAVVGRAFGMRLSFTSYLGVVPLLMIAAAVPITIQGRGITEVIAILLWQGPRASPEQIVLTCLAVYSIGLAQALIGGSAWALLRPYYAPCRD